MHYVVVAEILQETEASMVLPPCGVFSTIEKARDYISETFENTSIAEPWNDQFESELHRSKGEFGVHEEIYIWGREVDDR